MDVLAAQTSLSMWGTSVSVFYTFHVSSFDANESFFFVDRAEL